MAKLIQILIPILFLLATAASATTARSEVSSSSTSFSYNFEPLHDTTGLAFQGRPQATNWQNLPLTNAVSNTFSRVLYNKPVQFSQTDGQADFETTFSFQIGTPAGAAPGDGLVFFIAPVGTIPPNGAGGGNFGVFDASGNGPGIFAVEFDTFVNEWDPNYRHVGIDLGSLKSAVTKDVGDAIMGKRVTARISYAAAMGTISVAVETETEEFELSYEYDLCGLLPQQVQVGLAASTGEAFSAHTVFSWSFESKIVDTGATAAKSGRKQLIRQFV